MPFAALSDHRFTAHPFVLIAAIAEADLILISQGDLLKIVLFVRPEGEDEKSFPRYIERRERILKTFQFAFAATYFAVDDQTMVGKFERHVVEREITRGFRPV